jgi:hypothetical protein
MRAWGWTILFLCSLAGLRCSTASVAGGTGEETTNGIVAVISNQQGAPAAEATVRLRNSSYVTALPLPKAAGQLNYYNGTLDAHGQLMLDSVAVGSYVIEINDGNGYVLAVRCTVTNVDSLVDLGRDTLQQSCRVQGWIPTDLDLDYVQVMGLECLAPIDTLTGAYSIENLPAGEYTLRFVSKDPSLAPVIVDNVILEPGDSLCIPAYAAWRYSRTVTLNTSSNGAGVQSDVYGFPVLLRLNSQNFDFSQVQTDGADLRFTKGDGTSLPFEIERWDAAAAAAEVWVRVDTIRGNDAAQSITMRWGNAGAPPGNDPGGVFDTSAGFQGVWHLQQSAGQPANDATANGYAGIPSPTAPQSVDGPIGLAKAFDGVSNYFEMPGTETGRLTFQEHGAYTVSAWAYVDSFPSVFTELNGYGHIVAKGNYAYHLQTNHTAWQFAVFQNQTCWDDTRAEAQTGRWTYLVGVRNGERQFLYVNGICVDSVIKSQADTNSRKDNERVMIGRLANPEKFYFNGKIDEVRISSLSRSADWEKLCYMNQKAPDGLVEFK